MLSNEEREALRNFKSEYETCDHYSSDLIIELDDAEIILNLIKKQSKEIEELKEENKTLKNLQNDTNRLYTEMIERKNYFERELQKVENKIKAKIDYLLKRYDSEEDFCSYNVLISILKSLLRKEFPVTITKEELEKRWEE